MIINKNYKIESDSNNIVLLERRTITGTGRNKSIKRIRAVGEEYWLPTNFFSSVKNALHYIVEQEIMGTGLKDLETVVAKVQELHDMIDGLKV